MEIGQSEVMQRGERLGYLVALLVTCALILMALTIVGMEWLGARRVADCREGLPSGGDEWAACSERSDLFH